VNALKNFKDKVQSGIQKYRGGAADPRPQRQPHTDDFSRLARRMCGKSIGVVLGGGGARGISHLVSSLLRVISHWLTTSRDCYVHWKNMAFPLITLLVSETFMCSNRASKIRMTQVRVSVHLWVVFMRARAT
jgi:hypothetical protein